MTSVEASPFAEWHPGQRAAGFVVLVTRQRAETRTGKPYYRVQFRDARRIATTMVWSDGPYFAACESEWQENACYFVTGSVGENQYGLQLEITSWRPVDDDDHVDWSQLVPSSTRDAREDLAYLEQVVAERITDHALRELVERLLREHRDLLLRLPAAQRNHHAFPGGFVTHVRSVVETACHLAEKYAARFPHMRPALNVDLVIAGAVLHDIGKLRELEPAGAGAQYTPAGRLIGHILMGRDMVREVAATLESGLDPDVLLRLEHIIVAHQDRPEWGSPVAPATPEALLVHYADDVDAKFQIMAEALLAASTSTDDPFTGRDNPLRRAIYRGANDRGSEKDLR